MRIEYLVDGQPIEGDGLSSGHDRWREMLEEDIRAHVEAHYDEIIDDSEPEIRIWSCVFSPSMVLKKCDPIAYRCGIDDTVNQLLEDALYELDCRGSYDGPTAKYEIYCYDEDEDGEGEK